MAVDKEAWAVVPTIAQRRVVLVTSSDYYLETALALDPTISVRVIPPPAYTPGVATHADVVVFDGLLPLSRPDASLLVVGPPEGRVPGASIGTRVAGGPLSVVSGSPASIIRYVDVHDVQTRQTRALRLAGWLRPVLRSGRSPAVATGQHGGYREAVIAFATRDSDWPLRLSFPVFIHNLIEYLAPGTTLGTTDVRTGDPLPVLPSPSTRSLLVTRPDGSTDSIVAPFAPYTNTGESGIYSVQSRPHGVAPVLFSASPFPGNRSDAPAPPRSQIGVTSSARSARVSVPVDVSWMAALAVLALLCAEWWIGTRR
jgi:hypothetical protein